MAKVNLTIPDAITDAKGFNSLCKSIGRAGTTLDALVAVGIEYCVNQAKDDGNFDAFKKLAESCPVYARKFVRDAEKSAREAHKARSWRDDAGELAKATAIDELAERRQKTAQKRQQEKTGKRPTAPNQNTPSDSASTDVTTPHWQLVHFDGKETHKMALTEAEYAAALEAVAAYRKETKKARLAS